MGSGMRRGGGRTDTFGSWVDWVWDGEGGEAGGAESG